jgi:hypothetical protein
VFQLIHIVGELAQLVVPESLIRSEPLQGRLQRRLPQLTPSPLRVGVTRDEPGALEDFYVSGKRGRGHLDAARQLSDASLPIHQLHENGSPRWIGKGGKSDTERICGDHFRGL